MSETIAPLAPEKAAPGEVERFGQTVLSPEDVQNLKGQVEATLGSDEPNSVYKAIDQLSHLKRAGVQGLSVRLNREKLAQQREQLQNDPQTLARYLVRMKYLGLVDTGKVVDITSKEKDLIQKHIKERLAGKDTKNFAELCVSAKHLGIEISDEAKDTIIKEAENLADNPRGSNVDTYVKRRAQARYLGIVLSGDRGLEDTTKQRLAEHEHTSKWDQYARLQSLYTRATQQGLPLITSIRDSLVEHTATLKSDPAKVGRYLSDLKVIEQTLPVATKATVEGPLPVAATSEAQEPLAAIVKNSLIDPFFSEMANGEVGCGTDEGFNYGNVNEDAVVVNTATNDFVVIDGMGGPGRGSEAAGVLAESFKGGFAAGDSYAAIKQAAHKRMREDGLEESGAVLIAGRIRGTELQGTLVGDCRLVVMRNGEIVFATEDRGNPPPFHYEVGGPITGKSAGSMQEFIFGLQAGDRIVAGSDGLFESVAGYAETFNESYWGEIRDQFQGNDDVVAVADKALGVLYDQEGLNRHSNVYQQVQNLRFYLRDFADIEKLQKAGAVVADNQNAKLLSLVRGKSLKDALTTLEQQTYHNMESGKGKKDNRSIFIYDVKRVTLPQAIPVEERPPEAIPVNPSLEPAATKIPEATPVAEEQSPAPEPELPAPLSPEQSPSPGNVTKEQPPPDDLKQPESSGEAWEYFRPDVEVALQVVAVDDQTGVNEKTMDKLRAELEEFKGKLPAELEEFAGLVKTMSSEEIFEDVQRDFKDGIGAEIGTEVRGWKSLANRNINKPNKETGAWIGKRMFTISHSMEEKLSKSIKLLLKIVDSHSQDLDKIIKGKNQKNKKDKFSQHLEAFVVNRDDGEKSRRRWTDTDIRRFLEGHIYLKELVRRAQLTK